MQKGREWDGSGDVLSKEIGGSGYNVGPGNAWLKGGDWGIRER